MPARCPDGFCADHDIDEAESRVRFFLKAAFFAAAVYGGIDLGNTLLDMLGR